MKNAARSPGVKDAVEGSQTLPRSLYPECFPAPWASCRSWACFQNNPFRLYSLALHLPLMLRSGALSALQPPWGEAGTTKDGIPLTIVLGTVDDAHTTLRAVVREHQDIKEVLLCWVALQDLLVHMLHCL